MLSFVMDDVMLLMQLAAVRKAAKCTVTAKTCSTMFSGKTSKLPVNWVMLQ